MAFITQYLTGDQRIQLGRESFVRKFVWGTGWRKIRVGMFWAVNDPFTNIVGAGLKVGIAAGDSYGYDSPNIVDYIGYQHGSSWGGVTLTRQTSNGQPAYLLGSSITARKVGPTITAGSSNGSSNGYLGVVQSGILTAYIVEITKLNNGYNLGGYIYGYSIGLTQLSRFDLIASCESTTLVNAGSWGYLANSNPVVAYGGTQPFDSLCISWPLCLPTIEIGEILVTRHY